MLRSRWKPILAILIVVAAAMTAYYISQDTSDSSGETTPHYKEFVVGRGLFRIDVSATGVVKPIDRVEIKSKASGKIEYLPVEEGDLVSKDDVICRLDQTDVKADLDQARADLAIAEAELKQAQNTNQRRRELFDKGLISEEELDQTGLSVAQGKGRHVRARIALDQAEVRFGETVVKAPIDGIILKKYVEAGQIIASGISNVSGGTTIAAIADMRNVHIEAGIDEIDVGRIKVGQTAVVVAEAYPRRPFPGTIIRIAPEAKVEQNVTRFDVIVEVTNEDGRLKSGMNASVEITIVEKDDVLLAPAMALKRSETGGGDRHSRRALVKIDGQFVSRDIEIGMSDFRQAIVLSGLQEGDTLGVPMTSRLKAENDRLEQRIRSSRSFGTPAATTKGRPK